MTLFFLQESKEKNKFKSIINSISNKIEEKADENKMFLTLPIKIVGGAKISPPKKTKEIKSKKIKKIIKQLKKYNIKTAILSGSLQKIEQLKNELYAKNVNILDGRHLFKVLIEEIINYICNQTTANIEKVEVSILTNDVDNLNKEIIWHLAEKVKTLNIITNHINKFKYLEDYLYIEKGIIIKISNNYKTALRKSNIIINMDFPEEVINKYSIPNSCIINIKGRIKIKSKKFNGINVNDYNIIIPERYKIEGFNDKFIYESMIVNKEYKDVMKQLIDDKIKIKNLVGEKGVINQSEY